jgi:hypothetical protein
MNPKEGKESLFFPKAAFHNETRAGGGALNFFSPHLAAAKPEGEESPLFRRGENPGGKPHVHHG